MKILFYGAKKYDRRYFDEINPSFGHEITYLESHIDRHTVNLAEGYDAVCVFVNDDVSAEVLEQLSAKGVKLIALRCAGFNNVDLDAAERLNMTVVRVPAYSPYAVAEHTVALILSLNRKIHRAYHRVKDGNFALEGLLGFDLNGRTVGVVGTGKIGAIVVKILRGFGCHVLACDPYPNPECKANGAAYVEMEELSRESDIITLHCPLTPESHHMIDDETIGSMKHGVMLINTSRGALINAKAAIEGLKYGKIASLGLDVYE